MYFSKKRIQLLGYWQHLNVAKVWNLFRLYVSFQISRLIQKPWIWGVPATLSIEPTTSCNLRCPECPSGLRSFTRPTGMIDLSLFEKIIQENHKHLHYLHVYFQGEPFLHPYFTKLIEIAQAYQVYTATSTNAHYLTEANVDKTLNSGLRQLIVSVDGITQEIYQNYRIRGKLQKVEEGIRRLMQTRNNQKLRYPYVILQFLVTGVNEHQIPALLEWSKGLGIDELQLKSTQIYNFENGSPLIPTQQAYSRYVADGQGKWKLKHEPENKCWRMWQGAVITWDGRVVPCCFDKDAKHVFGTVQEESLESIWNNSLYHAFRTQLLADRSQIDICSNCTE
ncbi:radical SAM/SPASM domain-containing protein [Mongoliitalea daihaiensis]|uniref:radical SAM/SPASM domain-containing protein n=1 Tax=Mongoliitalea daihaiensis TaxID=2782006 RepID=UPI001F365895|nr:radical SAM/SPASM domain-containing protein [Mongoliitalea daihaiensis]UJP65990.1 SPASM domain-containing protein [Mongoliitalea daihaiensis]